MPELAVVSLSGGMDSCVTAALARAQGHELALLHADYGQRTQDRERRAFQDIADFYGVPTHRRLVIGFDTLKAIGGSALTDPGIALPEGELDRPGVPVSYVPFRNAHLLATCVSWAEVLGATAIYVGFVEEDSSGYPDCREAFLRSFVRKGRELGAPLHLSWSCYQGEAEACGHCDSCHLRLRGFQEAGFPDPIPYAFIPDSLKV